MSITASGPSMETGQAWGRRRWVPDPYIAASLLMAASSIGLGLLGGIVLFNAENSVPDRQPLEAPSPKDVDAETTLQRRKLAELRDAMRSQESSSPVATIGPSSPTPPVQDRTSDGGARSFQRNHALRRGNARQPQPAARPSPRAPEPPSRAELRVEAVADEVAEIRAELRGLASRIAQANQPITNYLADQIAAMHVEQRTIGSRIAVTEYATQQLHAKSWFDWCGLGATVLAAAASLLTAIRAPLKRLRRKPASAPI